VQIAIGPMTEEAARAVLAWHYEGLYAFYNADPQELHDGLGEMLAGSYYAATDEQGALVGFFCFGAPAQVPGGHLYGLYADEALDIGLGLRPDLTGRGQGRAFLTAGLDFARQRFASATFRLSVAAFNQRAIRLYETVGFQAVATFVSPTRNGEVTFLLMTLPASCAGSRRSGGSHPGRSCHLRSRPSRRSRRTAAGGRWRDNR
jgi:ribosomal-protein-alanine N-acetyltransferase